MRDHAEFEQALDGLGAAYDRIWRPDADRLWQALEGTAGQPGAHHPWLSWRVAVAILVLVLAGGGALEHALDLNRSVNLAFVPPKAPLRLTYEMRSTFRERTGPAQTGGRATETVIRSAVELTETFAPRPDGGYVLTIRTDRALTAGARGAFLPQEAPWGRHPVLTYVVNAQGIIVKSFATPAAASGMLYTGKRAAGAFGGSFPLPDRDLRPGDSWPGAGGTDVRYTYEGTAHGLLEIRSQGQLPAPDGVGQETIHSVILLDPRTHMLASSASTQTYVRAKHGGTSPVAVPERSTLTLTWRRVR